MRGAAAAAVCLLCVGNATTNATEPPGWLRTISAYRAMAGLAPVREESTWSASVRAHAEYVSVTGLITHYENPTVREFTRAGDEAGRNAILGAWTDDRTDRQLIDLWMTAPFHALHVLDPRLERSAFASVHGGESSRFQSVAVLDVGRGRGPKVRVGAPIAFPGPGARVPLSRFESEYPSPLASCPGFTTPAGLPIVIQFSAPPTAVEATLAAGGTVVEQCTITPAYTSSDPDEQATARRLLVQKNAVIILPRQPLDVGTDYTVTVTTNGATATWSFTVVEPGSQIDDLAVRAIVSATTVPTASTTPAAFGRQPPTTTTKRAPPKPVAARVTIPATATG